MSDNASTRQKIVILSTPEPLKISVQIGNEASDGYPIVESVDKKCSLKNQIVPGDWIYTVDLFSSRNWTNRNHFQEMFDKTSEHAQRRIVILRQDPAVALEILRKRKEEEMTKKKVEQEKKEQQEKKNARAKKNKLGPPEAELSPGAAVRRNPKRKIRSVVVDDTTTTVVVEEDQEQVNKKQKTTPKDDASPPPPIDKQKLQLSNNLHLPEALRLLKKRDNDSWDAKKDHRPEVKEHIVNTIDLHLMIETYQSLLQNDERLKSCQLAYDRLDKLTKELLEQKNAILLTVPEDHLTVYEQDLRRLVQYRIDHGDCNVMVSSKNIELSEERKRLGNFVNRQRKRYRYRNVDPKNCSKGLRRAEYYESLEDDIALLNKMGFIWNTIGPHVSWEDSFQQLKEYAAANDGNANIPQKYEPNQRLAGWAHNQRKEYEKFTCGEKSTMTPERIQKLDEIKFVWKMRFGRPKKARKPPPKPKRKVAALPPLPGEEEQEKAEKEEEAAVPEQQREQPPQEVPKPQHEVRQQEQEQEQQVVQHEQQAVQQEQPKEPQKQSEEDPVADAEADSEQPKQPLQQQQLMDFIRNSNERITKTRIPTSQE